MQRRIRIPAVIDPGNAIVESDDADNSAILTVRFAKSPRARIGRRERAASDPPILTILNISELCNMHDRVQV
jgi:hypothetical protein